MSGFQTSNNQQNTNTAFGGSGGGFGGGFGSNTGFGQNQNQNQNQNQQNTAFSGFGSNSNNQSNQQNSGSGFGSGFGTGFGSNNNQTPGFNSQFNWGSSNQQNQQNQQNQNQQNNQWSFGNFAQNQGQSQTPFNFSPPRQQQQNRNIVENPMNQAKLIFDSYSPGAPQCRFECILYNKVPRGTQKLFQKHPLTRPQLWEHGIKQNPNPDTLVPVSIRGYEQLKQRGQLCVAGHVAAMNAFEKLTNKVSEIRQNLDVKTKQEILDLKQTQSNLSYRLLTILREYLCRIYSQKRTALTNSTNQSFLNTSIINNQTSMYQTMQNPLTDNEIKLKQIFHVLLKEIDSLNRNFAKIDEELENININENNNNGLYDIGMSGMGGMGISFNNKENQNETIIGMDRSNIINNGTPMSILRNNNNNNINNNNTQQLTSGNAISQQAMKGMFEFLRQQQNFLANLNRTVQNDLDDLEVIRQGVMKNAL